MPAERTRPWFWWLVPFWGLIELLRGMKPSKGSSLLLWAWIGSLAITVGLMAWAVWTVRGILESLG